MATTNKVSKRKNKTFSVFGGMKSESISILRFLNYKPENAIAEFIDNSIQSFFDNKKYLPLNHKLDIKINISRDKKDITISDNAAGISKKKIEYALEAGSEEIRRVNNRNNGLNEFGMGMKSAAFWFTKSWTIETKAVNEKFIKIINLDVNTIAKKKGRIKVNILPTNETKSFTKIILKNCDKSIGHHKNIISNLESIHRNFLGKDIKIRYCYDKESSSYRNYQLKFIRPKFSREIPKYAYENWLKIFDSDYLSKSAKKNKPKNVYWKIPINIKFGSTSKKKLSAKGFIAKLVSSSEKRGIYYFRRNKMIEGPVYPGSIYSSQRGSGYEYKYIYGEIHFENISSSFTKDRLLIPEMDIIDFEIKLAKILKDKSKFNGTSFWDQLRVGIEGYQILVNKENRTFDESTNNQMYNLSSFNFKKQFESIKKNQNKFFYDSGYEFSLLNGNSKIIKLTKKDQINIDGKKYDIDIISAWQRDHTNSWLDYKIDQKNKKIYIQISLAHIFFKMFFFNSATSISGKETIKNGIILLSEFIISSIIYSISVSGIKKADQVLNNLNSILKEIPLSDQ